MGWTDELATAQRYIHAVDELRHEAARRMGTTLWGDSPATLPGVRRSPDRRARGGLPGVVSGEGRNRGRCHGGTGEISGTGG